MVGAEVGLDANTRLTLLVETKAGYRNLSQLITRAKLRHGRNGRVEKPIALPDELALYAPGLICLTGGDEGPLAHALESGSNGMETAQTKLDELIRLFGPRNVYVELQHHGAPLSGKAERSGYRTCADSSVASTCNKRCSLCSS
jgi:DNA polymerase III alpha subunit